MSAVLRQHAEQQFAEELHELGRADSRPRPPNWQLSPWAVAKYLLGGKLDSGFEITPKYIGNQRTSVRVPIVPPPEPPEADGGTQDHVMRKVPRAKEAVRAEHVRRASIPGQPVAGSRFDQPRAGVVPLRGPPENPRARDAEHRRHGDDEQRGGAKPG